MSSLLLFALNTLRFFKGVFDYQVNFIWGGKIKMSQLWSDSVFLLILCVVLGETIGSKRIKYFKLGSSATVFVGLIISYISTSTFNIHVEIPNAIFLLSLGGFIASVGLIASKSIKSVLKTYGIKFIILGIVVTFSGAISTYLLSNLFLETKYSIIGTYVGALTSSPGLATALELARNLPVDQSTAVALGYSIAYIPGILIVIFFAQLIGKGDLYGTKSVEVDTEKTKNPVSKRFSLVSFVTVVLVGIILGSVKIDIFGIGVFSLGMTGGVLISALLLGSWAKSRLYFDFDSTHLGIIRDISLDTFLAIVGLNYGYSSVLAIRNLGFRLLLTGLITGGISIVFGYLVGRYVLKLKPIYLVGGICGGMTSTPGLAAAIDSFGSEEVVAGYGASYPFALFSMIVLTKLLFI